MIKTSYFKKYFFMIFEYLFVITLIIECRTIYIHTTKISFVSKLTFVILYISVFACFFIKKKYKYSYFSYALLISFLSFILFAFIFLIDRYKESRLLRILFEIPLVIFYVGVIQNNIQSTLKKFTNVMVLIAIISIFFWIFASQLSLINYTDKWYISWGSASKYEKSYYDIYFETQIITIPIYGDIIRNSAIFTEAPMASFMFSISLISELFVQYNPNKFFVSILIIAILSTTSTTGIICLLLSIFTYLILNINKISQKYIKILTVFFLLFFLIICIFISINLLNEKEGTISGVSRRSDFINGINVFKKSPLIGYGFSDSSYDNGIGAYGFSNSIIPILIYGGLLLFLPYFLCIFSALVNCVLYKSYYLFAFYLIYMMMAFVTIVPFQLINFYIFSSMLFVKKEIKMQKYNKSKFLKFNL